MPDNDTVKMVNRPIQQNLEAEGDGKFGNQPQSSLPAERRTPPSGGSGVSGGSSPTAPAPVAASQTSTTPVAVENTPKP